MKNGANWRTISASEEQSSLRRKQIFQVAFEAIKSLQPFRSGLYSFLFILKYLLAIAFDQNPDRFSHAPAGGSENLHSVDSRDQESDAAVAHHTHALGKSVECLEFKTS